MGLDLDLFWHTLQAIGLVAANIYMWPKVFRLGRSELVKTWKGDASA